MRVRSKLSFVVACLALAATLGVPSSGVAGGIAYPGEGCPAVAPASAMPPLIPGSCTGIRPGALMTSPSGCTMNWVFRGATVNDIYIGTAAHCVSYRGQSVSLSGQGVIGQVAYTGWEDLYNLIDFALVKVSAGKLSQVNPAMCHWGGPVSMMTTPPVGPTAVPILHYGHGIGTGSFTQTKPRTGLAYGWVYHKFYFAGTTTFGDSGSPAMTSDGRAAGVIVAIGPTLDIATRLDDAIALAGAAMGVPLTLLTAPLA